jgi:hypothetical protein
VTDKPACKQVRHLIVVSANVVDIVAFAFRSFQVNLSPMRRGLGMMTNALNLSSNFGARLPAHCMDASAWRQRLQIFLQRHEVDLPRHLQSFSQI